MANYCTAENIKVMVGFTKDFDNSTSTRPTLTELNEIISMITGIIDLQLSVVGITSQLTNLNVLAKLKLGCIWGVCANAGFGSPQMNNRGDSTPKTYQELFDSFLKEIIDSPNIYTQKIDSDPLFSGYNENNDNSLLLDPEFQV